MKKGREESRMEPQVLCVHMEPGKVMRLSLIASSLGIQIRQVEEGEWQQPLSALFGLTEKKKGAEKVSVGEEMMVMAFFPEGKMDAFLDAIRKNKLPPVQLKAVLTAHNGSWNCGRLYIELKREDLFFRQVEKK